MNLSDTEIQLLGAATILLCVPALLRTEVKGKSAWVLYYPIVPIAAYILYELAQTKGEGEGFFRLDLLVIWPFLVWTLSKTWYRWIQVSKTTGPPLTATSELAITGFVTGVVGFVVPFFFIFSLAAVVCGHKAIKDPTEFRGKKLAGMGLLAGYMGLILGVIAVVSYLARPQ
jgi:hypothetical protein